MTIVTNTSTNIPPTRIDVDRERPGQVARFAFEVQPAARAVGDHREPAAEEVPAPQRGHRRVMPRQSIAQRPG